MNHKKLPFLIFILLGVYFNASGQGSCPPNIGFELGNTTVWNFFVGTCCPISTPTSTPALRRRHTLTSGVALDPHGLFPVVAPGSGEYSLMLGSDTVNSCAEKARYYVHVPPGVTDYSLVYRYACVLQDGAHLPASQPRFEVNAYDSATGNAVSCSQFNYVASSSIPGFYPSRLSGFTDVYCKGWTTSSINLSGLGGSTVIVDFSAGDCGYGAHFGYGYLDMSCGLFAISTVTCDTSTVTLTAPSGFEHYTWYDSTNYSRVLDTLQNSTFTVPSATITYAVILTPYPGYGCQDTLYTRVAPSRLSIHKRADTSVCFGTGPSIVLTTDATDIAMPLTYSWSAAPGLTCTTCADPVATPTGPTDYVFTIMDGVGCLHTDSIRIMGNTVANTVINTNEPCFGDSSASATVTVTSGSSPYTYRWTTSPVQTTPTATHLAAGTYTVNITDTAGCTGTGVATINEPGPTIIYFSSFSNPSTCGGHDGSITIAGLGAGTTDTISFTYGGSSSSVIMHASSTGTITISGLAAGRYDYFAVVTSGCPYNTIGPMFLFDPPTPAAPSVLFQSYCQYDVPAPVSATGTDLLWYGPGGHTGTGSSTAPIPSTAYAGVDTFYVTQTVAGCVSAPAADPVSITRKPGRPLTTDTSICQFSTPFALTAGGVGLKWYTSATSTMPLSSAPTPSTTTIGSTTWYVTQKIDGCTSDESTITVTVLYKPIFTIAQSRNYVCQFDTLTFSYNGSTLSGASYAWSIPPGDTIFYGSDSAASIVLAFDSLKSPYIILTASDYGKRCNTSDTIHIRVLPEPFATPYMRDMICAGDTALLALSGISTDANKFIWDFDGANIISEGAGTGGPYTLSWAQPGTFTVKVTALSNEGCRGQDAFDTVHVLPAPDARILSPNNTGNICLEDSVYLSAADTTAFGNLYIWTPAHFFHNLNRPTTWGRIEAPGYIKLDVINPFGCESTDSVLISPDACCTITFPTAFTPNGDGKNDLFRPIANGTHNFHIFRVENRWGQTVFETTNSTVQWDGTLNGIPQDMGTYFYYIKFDCGGQTQESKGTVTLIR